MVNDWKMWRHGEAARPPPARGSERRKFAVLWRKCGMMTRTPRLEGKMPKLSAKLIEHKCPACNGTGFRAVQQPAEPDRRIYPPRCTECAGKGRVEAAD
jgi:hypothetical protein